MITNLAWPRARAWPPVRSFDRVTVLDGIVATTTSASEQVMNYDPDTKKTTTTTETHFTPAPAWSSLITQPDLGRDEAWFYYSILWKQPELSIEKATTASRPTSPLARVRTDLAERSTTAWFDAKAYWCCLTGLLSREDMARFVGDARIFVHSYKNGGASIITSYGDRLRFIEAFYQVVVPYLGEAEWKLVANEIGTIGVKLLGEVSIPLATQRMRLAAASGLFDQALLAMIDAADQAGVDVFDVLHAMRDPNQLATHAPRLTARLLDALVLEKWIDRFGGTQAGWIIESINAATTKKDATPLVATLVRMLPTEVLSPIMQGIRDCKAKPDVERWFARQTKSDPGARVKVGARSGKAGKPAKRTRGPRRA